MHNTAEKQRQKRNAHAAQPHRPLLPRKQQTRQRQQRKRQQVCALADHRADATVQPFQQHAVDRQNRQQAQKPEHAPDSAPCGAGQDRLRLGRTPRGSFPARRSFFGCGFLCSQRVFPSLYLLSRAAQRAAYTGRQPVFFGSVRRKVPLSGTFPNRCGIGIRRRHHIIFIRLTTMVMVPIRVQYTTNGRKLPRLETKRTMRIAARPDSIAATIPTR